MLLIKTAGLVVLVLMAARVWRTRPRAQVLSRESAAWEILTAGGEELPPGREVVLDFTKLNGRAVR